MRDHDRAAGEVEQRVLERAQRVDVEVVRRLVEQQQVPARAQQLREVDAVPLAAGEVADPLLLVRPAEVEPGDVLARVHLALAELDRVEAAGDLLPDRALRVEVAAGLVDVGELTVSPTRSSPASGSSSPAIIRKSVVLPAPFGPITPTMPPGGSENDRSSTSRRSPKPFATPSASTTRSPSRGPAGMWISTRSSLTLLLLREQLLVGGEARLRLRLPRPRATSAPTRARAPARAGAPTPSSPRARAAPASARASRSSCPRTGCPRPRSSSRIQPATLSRK